MFKKLMDIMRKGDLVDQAVQETDSMFSDRIQDADDLVFVVSDNLLEARVKRLREDAKNVIEGFKALLDEFPDDQNTIDQELEDADQDMLTVQDFLFSLSEALSIAIVL